MFFKAKQGRLPTPEDVEAAKKAPKMDKEKVMRAYDKLMQMQKQIYQKYESRHEGSSDDDSDMEELPHAHYEVERQRGMICYEVDLIKVEDTLFALEGVSSWDVEQTLMHFVE